MTGTAGDLVTGAVGQDGILRGVDNPAGRVSTSLTRADSRISSETTVRACPLRGNFGETQLDTLALHRIHTKAYYKPFRRQQVEALCAQPTGAA
jgi:hypothetical protein